MKNHVQPSISFLICTRNRSEIVQDCIKTLLDSGRSDIEVIIRDSASIDNTWEKIQKIKDPRVKVYKAPMDQGNFSFIEISKLASGRITTWISDEDDFQFEHLDWIVSKFENPECNAMFGSILVGNAGRSLIFAEEDIDDPVRSNLTALSFSGCGGVFVRTSCLPYANSLKYSTPDEAYILWNNYPIGFLAGRCAGSSIVTTSKIVVKQARFAKTTNNWNKLPKATYRLPHYYPETMFDRLVSNIVYVFYTKISVKAKMKLINLLIKRFLYMIYMHLEHPELIKLLHENYEPEVVEKYINHINKLKLNRNPAKLFWLLNKIIKLIPAVLRNKAQWKRMGA